MVLEAYSAEPIRIKILRHEPMRVPEAVPALDMDKDEECLFREVELLGESSGSLYAHATSVINKQSIQSSLFEHLDDKHEGIGVVLRNVAKGSFREVLDLCKGGVMTNNDLNRTYRVNMNAVPAILITEEFPLDVYTRR